MNSVEDFFQSISKLDKVRDDLKKSVLQQQNRKPSYFLNELITRCSTRDIEQFIRESSKLYVTSTKFITSTVCIFIDAFDQTLTDKFMDNIELWKNGQLGLLKAIHKLHVHNKHIKVYSSIRQEAFSGFNDPDRAVIKGKSALLQYSKEDLLKLFIHAINEYTSSKTIAEFVGFDKIQNKFVNQEENLFDYIYRHSIYTPRSIIGFGKAIHELDEKTEENIKFLINSFGASSLVQDYILSEKLVFLSYINNLEDMNRFLKLLPSNVLHYKALDVIKNEFANEKGYISSDCHPFCELFNIGLLGQVVPDLTHPNIKRQEFIKPHKFDWKQNHIINSHTDSIYLIHPSLYESITKLKGEDYRINTKNVVGDEKSWESRVFFPSIFLSHSSIDKVILENRFIKQFEAKMNTKYPVDIWYDKNNIAGGENINNAVERGITDSNIVIVFISKQSLSSGWVEKEWRSKHNEEITNKNVQIISVIIDSSEISNLPPFLKEKNSLRVVNDDWDTLIAKLSFDIYKHLKTNKVI